MKKIVSLLILICIGLSSISCDDVNNPNGGSQNKTIVVPKLVMNNLYKTMPEFTIKDPVDSYTDGKYNYFYFKLGEVARVPIAYTKSVFYQGIGKRTLNFESTNNIQSMLSATAEQCISTTVSSNVSTGVNSNLGVTDKVSGISASLGAYIQSTLSTSSTCSTSKKLTDSITETFTKREQDIFELDPSCPAGVYRYTIYANCEIYAIVIANLEEESFEYAFMPFVKDGSLVEGWVYSEDGYYETNETIYNELERFSLDNLLSGLDLYGNIDKFINVRQGTLSLKKSEIIGDDYYYTLFPNFASVLNEEMLEQFGYSKAEIKVVYKVKTPEGACQTHMRICIGNKELCRSDFVRVDTSGKTCTIKCEVSLEDLKAADYKIRLEFECRSDGILDILKNSFYIESGTVTIEMK